MCCNTYFQYCTAQCLLSYKDSRPSHTAVTQCLSNLDTRCKLSQQALLGLHPTAQNPLVRISYFKGRTPQTLYNDLNIWTTSIILIFGRYRTYYQFLNIPFISNLFISSFNIRLKKVYYTNNFVINLFELLTTETFNQQVWDKTVKPLRANFGVTPCGSNSSPSACASTATSYKDDIIK